MHHNLALLAAASALVSAGAGHAKVVAISGTIFNTTAPPGIGAAPCGMGQALISVNPGNSTQITTSSFGSFGYTLSHCVPFPPIAPFNYAGSSVTYAFAGGSLLGTYSGSVGPTNDPFISTHLTNILITGGTGIFAGATGWMTANGTLDRTSGITLNDQSFAGRINAPAIPEPASWALMIAGFGLVGRAARRKRPMNAKAVDA